ncbi:MAG: hypothetical protein JW778_06650 [Candidatus Altiarchaeota archaeon]|nr:hypothetical protein [Candidatus Altiarchaeota archaeon]
MKDLAQIKRVEQEVVAAVETAKKESESKIAKSKAEGAQIIQQAVDKAKREAASDLERTKSMAREDAEGIIASGKAEVVKIQTMASKKKGDAIELVIRELRGD